MLFDVNSLVREVEFLDRAIIDKYRASGSTFAERVAGLKGKAPEKIVDDLTCVAQLHERAQKGETPTDEELTQCAAKIDAVYPVVATRNKTGNWIVWVALVAAALYACRRFLPR